MAKIETLSYRRNSHVINFMYKRKESPQYINNAEGKPRLIEAIVLNEARVLHISIERNVYYKGARAWNSQKRNVKEIFQNLPVS